MNREVRRSFIIGTILSGLLVLAGNILAPIEVRFVNSITDSATITGFIFGGASIVLVFLSQLVARWSNQFGRKRVIIGGVLFSVVYALLYASVVNTFGVLGVKFAWAFAIAATNPVLAAYIQQLLVGNKKQGTFFGYYYAAGSIAGSIGALLGGYIYETYSFVYVAYALMLTYSLAFLMAACLPNQKAVTDEGETRELKNHSVFALLRQLWKKPALRFYLASNIPTAANWGVKPFLWPLVIFAISGSDLTTGAIFATMGVVAFLLLPFAGMVADRFGPYRIILFELTVFVMTGITMALTGSIAVLWIAAGFYTIAEVLNLAQAMILTEELDDDIRTQAMALDTAFDQIIGFMSPLVAGVLVTLYSPSVALLCFMALYTFGLLATVLLVKKHNLITPRT